MILMTALTLKSQTQKYKPRTLYLLMKMLRQWGKKSKDLRKEYLPRWDIYSSVHCFCLVS